MRGTLIFVAYCLGCAAPAVPPERAPTTPPVTVSAPREPIVEDNSPEAIARKFLLALSSADRPSIAARFDDAMREALPAEDAIALFDKLEAQFGAFAGEDGVRVESQGAYRVVFLTIAFERGKLDMKVALDEERKIAGLFFVPPSSPYVAPSYADLAKLEEEEVVVGKDPFRLPGTLTLPRGTNGKWPGVVLVHGSGPNDRDETIGPNKPLKDLALGLASRGVAVVRYEKRTRVYPKELASKPDLTVDGESIDDAILALELLSTDARVDASRLFVVGHSLGAYLGPRIAKRAPNLAGLVMLCPPARTIPELVVEQLTYLASLDKTTSAEESRGLDEAKAARDRVSAVVKAGTGKEGEMMFGAPASYWIDLAGYDPVAAAAALTLPIAIFHGGRDYQVRDVDFATFERKLRGPRFTLKRFPTLNHLLQPGEGLGVPEEYAVRNEVAGEVIDEIVAFIGKRSGAKTPASR